MGRGEGSSRGAAARAGGSQQQSSVSPSGWGSCSGLCSGQRGSLCHLCSTPYSHTGCHRREAPVQPTVLWATRNLGFWGWKSTCWVSAPLSAREGSFKVLFIYFFSIQLQTWGVWRCCCWVGIFWSHLFIRGDDFQLQGCCLQLRQLLKAHPGLVRGGKKVEMQMQSDVCSTQKSPLRAGGCLAKSKRAFSQAEAGNYVLYFSGLSKEAVSRQTF